jgi:hypothetical protein
MSPRQHSLANLLLTVLGRVGLPLRGVVAAVTVAVTEVTENDCRAQSERTASQAVGRQFVTVMHE